MIKSKTYGDAFTFLGTEFTTLGLVGADSVASVTLTSVARLPPQPWPVHRMPSASAATGTGLE